MSKLQELARKRNWLKYMLFGSHVPSISSNPYTKLEEELINRINEDLKTLRENFNYQSRLLGLIVSNRCFCGKKTTLNSDYCNKHNDFDEFCNK